MSKSGEKVNCAIKDGAEGDNIELTQRFNYVREVLHASKGFRIKTKDESNAFKQKYADIE